MFTGIIEDLGRVAALEPLPDAVRLSVVSSLLDDLRPGDSVAVNGVCLTAAEVVDGGFTADVMQETLRRSTLGALAPDDAINIERAVTPATRLGGHVVQGHVDGVATVVARRPSAHWDEVDITLPAELLPYVVTKGSVAFDGVSLTIATINDAIVTVCLIPETLQRTTLGRRGPGTKVNVEVDILAKYVERALAMRGADA